MTGADERLVASAARNNAAWCDIVCRLHGIVDEFREDAWTSIVRTPLHYPDAVTLCRSADAARVLARVDASVGCSIKDSFADLDLAAFGFETLFEASRIHRAASPATSCRGALDCDPVRDEATLRAWETAWDGEAGGAHVFRSALLARDDVVLAPREAEAIVAGAILSLDAGVVGLSNLFAVNVDLAAAFTGVTAAAHRLYPQLALVGYEAGAFLDAAQRAGFERVGRLIVWLKREPLAPDEKQQRPGLPDATARR